MTRITNKNLGDACRNPDGKTYDARKLAQWLFEATTGNSLSDADAQQIVDDAAAKAKARRAESLAHSGDETPPLPSEQSQSNSAQPHALNPAVRKSSNPSAPQAENPDGGPISQRPISHRAITAPRMNAATIQSSEARQDLVGQCQSERSRDDVRPAEPNPEERR